MQNKVKDNNLDFYHLNLLQNGYALLTEEDLPFTSQEWEKIGNIIPTLKYETAPYGDSGEPMELEYFRIKKSYQPEIYHGELWKFFTSEKIIHLYQGITGLKDLYLDRCQIHKLKKGGYLGRHEDIAEHPQYKYTCIYFLDENYDGGELVFHPENASPISIKPPSKSLIIVNSTIAHEINTVTHGNRTSLCCFFSERKPLPKVA